MRDYANTETLVLLALLLAFALGSTYGAAVPLMKSPFVIDNAEAPR